MTKVNVVCLVEDKVWKKANKKEDWKFGKKYEIDAEEAKILVEGGYVSIAKK